MGPRPGVKVQHRLIQESDFKHLLVNRFHVKTQVSDTGPMGLLFPLAVFVSW